MTKYKPKTELRIVENGIVGKIDLSGFFVYEDGITPDGVFKRSFSIDGLKSLGLTLELVEPLPEEPPKNTAMRFKDGCLIERVGDFYYSTGAIEGLDWEQTLDNHGTGFTIIEERDETIREVLDLLDRQYDSMESDRPIVELVSKHFGVSLDG